MSECCSVVLCPLPPSPKYYEKKHYSGQNRTLIKYKSDKSIVLFTNYTFSSSYLWLLLY